MKIAVFTKNSFGYSGGRYHKFILNLALANAGHNLDVFTNRKPNFIADFFDYKHLDRITYHDLVDVKTKIPDYDVVIVVPDTSSPLSFYFSAIETAYRCQAKLLLLNFETPNWYNSMVKNKKDPSLWRGWSLIAQSADAVISISKEGTKYAKQFFKYPHLQFFTSYPSINSHVADHLQSVSPVNQCIYISTYSDRKNYQLLLSLCDKKLKGNTLLWVEGTGKVDTQTLQTIRHKAAQSGVEFRIKSQISDVEKFYEIYRSKVLIFLSEFEGFGMPPIEALYSNRPCVAFRLPVLEEIAGKAIDFVDQTNTKQLVTKVAGHLASQPKQNYRSKVSPFATFDSHVNRIDAIVNKCQKTAPTPNIQQIRTRVYRKIAQEKVIKLIHQAHYQAYLISQRIGFSALRSRLKR